MYKKKLEIYELQVGKVYSVIFKNGWRTIPCKLKVSEIQKDTGMIGFTWFSALYSMDDVSISVKSALPMISR